MLQNINIPLGTAICSNNKFKNEICDYHDATYMLNASKETFLKLNVHRLIMLTVRQSLAGVNMLTVIFRHHCSGTVCGYRMVGLGMV